MSSAALLLNCNMLQLFFGFYLLHFTTSEKCYSCSSPLLHLRWPKDDDTNKLLYLSDFPYYANESCDMVKNMIPVVDCPNSVCIKAVIKEPPAKREACIESGAVVRDCWSRVMDRHGPFPMVPQTRNNMVRLTDDALNGKTIGYIYTCEGFLCNQTSHPRLQYLIWTLCVSFLILSIV